MFTRIVLDKLRKGSLTSILSHQELRANLDNLVEKCHGWLTLVNNPDGEILRMNRNLSAAEFLGIINKLSQ